jgi:hypothetical protein
MKEGAAFLKATRGSAFHTNATLENQFQARPSRIPAEFEIR